MNVENLADFATLQKLAAALWQQDSAYHGAAIMIGAGFSRSSSLAGDTSKKLPLWDDISKVLAQELGSSLNTGPLRLAEEYCAYFGRQALHDLLKKTINDGAWQPGELHKPLLDLPWSEVLTTNWDTLLERASTEVHQHVYNLVNRQEDLASLRSPRIVKLHGTINVTEDLVFTQEDYRTYPKSQAAFVNFARQVFIENELCLLGFSGDDPNFLQWAGWVRDQLSTRTRRIYLAGALSLTAAKRKYLESISIAPIDLGHLVSEYDDPDARHHAATRLFIQALRDLKPKRAWEWHPTRIQRTIVSEKELNKAHEAGHAAAQLARQTLTFESDRLAYPGWLICPAGRRWELQTQISDPYPSASSLSAMETESRSKLLYEIAWRYQVTYEAVPTWLVGQLLKVCDPATPCALTKKKQMQVALLLLKNTRWIRDDDSTSVEQITASILEKHAKYWPDSRNELAYHRAIVARDLLDYPSLEEHACKISEDDPVWRLRKAALYAELGRFEDGERLVAGAYRELLGEHRKDRNSLHALSRLAWAHWLQRGIDTLKPGNDFEAFPSTYHEPKCSPWDQIEHLQTRIRDALEKQQKKRVTIQPLFEPGHYRDSSTSLTISNELHPLLLMDGISISAGMPLRWNNVSFLVDSAARLAELEGIDEVHRFALAIRAANSETSDTLNAVFSRAQIARLAEADVAHLLDSCRHAIDYWSSRLSERNGRSQSLVIERLRVFMEVLARVSVRASPEQAKAVYRRALALGSDPLMHHLWLASALNHLIEYSLESVPRSQHHELLQESLRFPLQCEINMEAHGTWPNPIIESPGARVLNAAVDGRIGEIIDSIAPCSAESAPALLRLFPLLERGFLTNSECTKIATGIWGTSPSYDSLPDTGLLQYALIQLPSHDPSAVRTHVRRYLFCADGGHLFEPVHLTDMINAAHAEGVKEVPSGEQANDYFNRLVSWRPKGADPFGLSGSHEARRADLIARALASVVVPALPLNNRNEESFSELCRFHAEVQAPATIIAISHFAAAGKAFIPRIEKLIKAALQHRSAAQVAAAAHALFKWREVDGSRSASSMVSRMIYMIESNRIVGLFGLLGAARQMLEKNLLSHEDINSLVESLPAIYDDTDYERSTPFGSETVSISIVRAECVKLTRSLLDSGRNSDELSRLLEKSSVDALPEVRFA